MKKFFSILTFVILFLPMLQFCESRKAIEAEFVEEEIELIEEEFNEYIIFSEVEETTTVKKNTNEYVFSGYKLIVSSATITYNVFNPREKSDVKFTIASLLFLSFAIISILLLIFSFIKRCSKKFLKLSIVNLIIILTFFVIILIIFELNDIKYGLYLLILNSILIVIAGIIKKKSNTNMNYYFLGIGGIGMSALARYFKAKGCEVSGYDRTQTVLTHELESEGINVHYSAQIPLLENLPADALVVYTPAVPEDFEEFVYLKNNGFRMLKRAQVLGEITRAEKGICIAGTHGKTSTSTMTAHLIYQSHVGCSAFLGGVSKNYDTNFLVGANCIRPNETTHKEGECNTSVQNYIVIEADEYDRSFHQLSPYMALITAADADHLDIYGSKDEFRMGFEKFASLVKPNGFLVVKEGLDLRRDVACNVCTYTYGMTEGDFHAENINIENGEIHFDFVTPTEIISDIQLGVPVLINVENAVGAMTLAYLAGVKPDELRAGMASFAGIRRRFDFQVKTDKIVYLDDYAHHPEELRASISSIKALYPNKKICGIFQPHLYTRTRDFMDGFAETLSLLDELILLDIYPARELPIEGVSSDIIFDKVTIKNKTRATKENLLTILKNKELEGVLVTFGAGDIDTCVPKIKEMLMS